MGDMLWSALAFILTVEFIVGNLANAFMALVNLMDWVHRRKVSSVDLILTTLAFSRLGQLWSIFIHVLIVSLHPAIVKMGKMIRIHFITSILTNHFSLWLATCLSIFYFLKIAIFSNSIFLYLKWRVQKVVSMMLMLSLAFLFINIIAVNTHINVDIAGLQRNMSYTYSLNDSASYPSPMLLINNIFTFVPFTVSLTTFLLLIFSLCKHLKMMQHSATGPRDASTMAHVKALQMVVAFLLLYTMFFLGSVVHYWSSVFLQKNPMILFFHVIGLAFPAGHSCVLIQGNSKLRQASVSVLWWLRCRCKDAQSLGSSCTL